MLERALSSLFYSIQRIFSWIRWFCCDEWLMHGLFAPPSCIDIILRGRFAENCIKQWISFFYVLSHFFTNLLISIFTIFPLFFFRFSVFVLICCRHLQIFTSFFWVSIILVIFPVFASNITWKQIPRIHGLSLFSFLHSVRLFSFSLTLLFHTGFLHCSDHHHCIPCLISDPFDSLHVKSLSLFGLVSIHLHTILLFFCSPTNTNSALSPVPYILSCPPVSF